MDTAGAPLQYASALGVLRMHIGPAGHLYSLHNFRVGGAQALALAGRSVFYIMGRGRWKTTESVSRYVAPPSDTQCSDARAMSTTIIRRPHARAMSTTVRRCARKKTARPQKGDAWHTHLEGGRVLPQLYRGRASRSFKGNTRFEYSGYSGGVFSWVRKCLSFKS